MKGLARMEKTEIPSKLTALTGIVATIANTLAKITPKSGANIFTVRLLLVSLLISIERAMMPSVAKAESKRAVEYTAFGNATHIMPTEIKRLVRGSRAPANIKSRQDMISISPARTTDIGRPVITEYIMINGMSRAFLMILFILKSERIHSINALRIARCIPLRANI